MANELILVVEHNDKNRKLVRDVLVRSGIGPMTSNDVLARTWACSRYEELRRQFKDWRDVGIVLDRREEERRAP